MDKKVLIAEDNDDIRRLVVISLKRLGYDLYEAADGAQALARAREVKPDLIVLDVMMPEMNGYEVCQQLKKDPSTNGIKILFLTSRTGVPAEMTMNKAGGDGILTKPFNPIELREKVEAMLLSLNPSSNNCGSIDLTA